MFGIETYKIYIYPLGGISIFNMPLNIAVFREFIILIMGPIFQNIAYILLLIILKDTYLITKIHIGILVFNLLPIYPLDGGKLLNLLFTKIMPYKLSYKLAIYISYLMAIIILFNNNKISINMILVYLYLLFIIRKEDLQIDYKYNKFLLERYLNNYNYKKNKIISNINSLYRTRNNILKTKNNTYTEKQFLFKNFTKKY